MPTPSKSKLLCVRKCFCCQKNCPPFARQLLINVKDGKWIFYLMSVGDGKHRHWMHTYPNMAKNHPTESERQIELDKGR